jgi:hypothetical protein
MEHDIISLLKETINHYNSKNRSFEYGRGCKYLSGQGKMCAVGRCLKPKYLQEFYEIERGGELGNTGIHAVLQKTGYYIGNIVREEYSNINLTNWVLVQSLHDQELYWDENGLSESGKKFVKHFFPEGVSKEVLGDA